MALPVYLIAPPGPRREGHASELGADAVVFDEAGSFDGLEARSPGIVIVDLEGSSDAQLLSLADRVSRAGPGWRLALIGGGQSPLVRSLSLGAPTSLGEVGRFAAAPEAEPDVLLELHVVLEEVARVRHDVNNPLTAALAEAQLLLLDTEEGEARESLEVVQEQLRRIRDLIASTGHLRPPKK